LPKTKAATLISKKEKATPVGVAFFMPFRGMRSCRQKLERDYRAPGLQIEKALFNAGIM